MQVDVIGCGYGPDHAFKVGNGASSGHRSRPGMNDEASYRSVTGVPKKHKDVFDPTPW